MTSTMVELAADDFARVADELHVSREQVAAVTALLDDGNTVPFITRYRKERTGNLDEEQIRGIQQRIGALRQLAERAETILRLIEAQGALTPRLREQIAAADSLKRLEDLYLPYRPKRQSRGTAARSKGLEPLAVQIWNREVAQADLDSTAKEFVDPEKELPGTAEVLQGAADILAERVSDNAEVRETARKIAWRTGQLKVQATASGKENGKQYQNYFDYSEAVSKIPHHRCLAINRGEKENHLRVKFAWDGEQAEAAVLKQLDVESHPCREFLRGCVHDALHRLIQPSLDREIRRDLTERAEGHAIEVFAANLRNLLLQPPLSERRVVAIDPGYRTGCKVAVLDEMGNCLATDVIYVTGSADKKQAAREKLAKLLEEYECRTVAIGNGTACRECEELISEAISTRLSDARYTIVNEAGASIYSTSAVARDEFPDRDATVRGTISIGRRLQDPLSELVKIDPQHIGVGMYQHDVSTRRLKESLDQIVESCVNYVGVDLNTASSSLLRYVSGFNQLIARRVVEWRAEHGRFSNRRQLLDVPGIGESTFTQSAGFLKIKEGGDNPLDRTWIHPESYEAAGRVLDRLSISPGELRRASSSDDFQQQLLGLDVSSVAEEIEIGVPTCRDIVEALARPDRDPRSQLSGPVFKQDVLKLDDLEDGMELQGTVLNVVDFGVFVDIGLKDSGLVHISEMSQRYVRSPHEIAAVGDVVTVWVLGVDRERRRVSLTMIQPGTKPPSKQPDERNGETAPPAPASKKRSRTPASRAGKTTAKQKRKHKNKESKGPPPELTSDMRDGREPLKGFDQLQRLWKERKK